MEENTKNKGFPEIQKALKGASEGKHATLTFPNGKFVILSWKEYRKLCEKEIEKKKEIVEIRIGD